VAFGNSSNFFFISGTFLIIHNTEEVVIYVRGESPIGLASLNRWGRGYVLFPVFSGFEIVL
jgi:hypothetical protein